MKSRKKVITKRMITKFRKKAEEKGHHGENDDQISKVCRRKCHHQLMLTKKLTVIHNKSIDEHRIVYNS